MSLSAVQLLVQKKLQEERLSLSLSLSLEVLRGLSIAECCMFVRFNGQPLTDAARDSRVRWRASVNLSELSARLKLCPNDVGRLLHKLLT